MSGILERLTGSPVEGLLRELSNESYLSLSGVKVRTRIGEIMKPCPDFGEPGLFFSAREREPEEAEAKAGRALASSFLADAYLLYRTSSLTDAVTSLEAGETFTAGGRTLSLRSLDAELTREPHRDIREEMIKKAEGPLASLNKLLREKLDFLTEGSEALGFQDYGKLRDETGNVQTDDLTRQAVRFLSDTGYVSRDLLSWFMTKGLEINPGQAKAHDVAHLLNSGELRGYFPARDLFSFSKPFLDALGLTPAGGTEYDSVKRTGKSSFGLCIPLNPPSRTGLSVYSIGGVRDYESFLGALGGALSFMYTDPGDEIEFRWLRDEAVLSAFSSLFGNLVYEPRWLAKYLKIDAGKDFRRLLNLRRLMSARLGAAMTLYEAELLQNRNMGSMPGSYVEFVKEALHCGAHEPDYLRVLTEPVSPAYTFKGSLIEPALANYLRETYDEEWWRVPAAGDYLKGIWSGGGRVTAESLSAMTGSAGAESSSLTTLLEKSLR